MAFSNYDYKPRLYQISSHGINKFKKNIIRIFSRPIEALWQNTNQRILTYFVTCGQSYKASTIKYESRFINISIIYTRKNFLKLVTDVFLVEIQILCYINIINRLACTDEYRVVHDSYPYKEGKGSFT